MPFSTVATPSWSIATVSAERLSIADSDLIVPRVKSWFAPSLDAISGKGQGIAPRQFRATESGEWFAGSD
jgi:hypothetical protein